MASRIPYCIRRFLPLEVVGAHFSDLLSVIFGVATRRFTSRCLEGQGGEPGTGTRRDHTPRKSLRQSQPAWNAWRSLRFQLLGTPHTYQVFAPLSGTDRIACLEPRGLGLTTTNSVKATVRAKTAARSSRPPACFRCPTDKRNLSTPVASGSYPGWQMLCQSRSHRSLAGPTIDPRSCR